MASPLLPSASPLSAIHGLRRRLLVIVAIAVLPALLLVLYNAKERRDELIGRINTDAETLLATAVDRQLRFVDSAHQLLSTVAQVPQIGAGEQSCSQVLKTLVERYPGYVNIGVANPDGAVICSALNFDGAVNVSRRAYFQRAVSAKSFAIGDFQIGKITRRASVNFAYPVFSAEGAVAAVLFAAFDLRWLTDMTSDVQVPDGATLTVFDSNGTILTRFPDAEKWIGQSLAATPLYHALERQRLSSLTTIDGSDRSIIHRAKRISEEDFAGDLYVAFSIPRSLAIGPSQRALVRNLSWLAAASLLAFALAWLVGDRIVVQYIQERAAGEEQRARLAAIVESSDDGIVGLDLTGRIASWNSGAEGLYGYSAAEMMNRSFAELIPDSKREEIALLIEIIRTGKSINRYESERQRKDGSKFIVSASLSPILDRNGIVIGAANIARDVTVQRQGEQQLVAYANHLETLYAIGQEVAGTLASADVLQRGLNYALSTSGFEFALAALGEDGLERFSYASASSDDSQASASRCHDLWNALQPSIGQPSNPVIVDDTQSAPALAHLSSTCGVQSMAIFPLAAGSDARVLMVLASGKPHQLSAESHQFLKALLHQISLALENAQLYGRAERINEKLRLEIEERKRAEQALADFTAMIVHDLRSPLSNVVSIANSMRDGLFGTISEMQGKWLDKILSNCRSLIQHVSDYLDLSKIDAGKMELSLAPADINDLVNEAVGDFLPEAQRRQIALQADLADGLPPALVDGRRLDQVLNNLLSNAQKFTEDGGAIKVSTHTTSAGQIAIAVGDSGRGIPQEESERIFEAYRQIEGDQHKGRRGSGLGLAICKKIVEAHGGQISLQSEAGRGTCVTFTVPVARSSVRADDSAEDVQRQ